MSNILAHGVALQPTSYAMLTTVSDIFTQEGVRQSTPTSATIITTPPTFAGITGVTPKQDGSLNVQWGSVTSPNAPFEFQIFIALGNVSAATLFALSPTTLAPSSATNIDINKLSDQTTYLVNGQIYTVGVRCKDGVQNQNTNLTILTVTAIASGNLQFIYQTIATQLAATEVLLAADEEAIAEGLGAISLDLTAVKNKTDNLPADPASNTVVNTRASQTSVDDVQASVDAIPINPLLTNDVRLNNLDATITSRASQASINNIQNNTSFVGIVPEIMDIPNSGSETYKIFASLFDSVGTPEDPDGDILNYRIEDHGGTVLVPTAAMTKDSVGVYHTSYTVNSGDADKDLVVVFEYSENSVAFTQYRTSKVQANSGDLQTLLSRLTPQRALNLDNLDAPVSSKSNQTDVDTLNLKLTSQRASNLDNLDAPVSDIPTNAELAASLVPIAKTTDIAGLAQANYTNRMTTVYRDFSQDQEIIVWAERDGQRRTDSTNCTVSVYGSNGNLIWTASASTPNADGVYKFINALVVTNNLNFYVVISIEVDGSPRINQQPFFTVG